MMRSSYAPEDVTILLKDITGMVEPLPASEREKRIQSGIHYCEMLPLEYKPSEAYMKAYRSAEAHYAAGTAEAVGVLAEKLYRKKGDSLVLVSLARAGIPIGILLRRYLKRRYGADIPHYAISIIRGRGIDKNAMRAILEKHAPGQLQFVDGWIGKGAILRQLREALTGYPDVSPELGVLSDPAGLTELCGTHEDILIPSSCLNAVVTGLISRTFLRPDVIGEKDFHGAVYYQQLESEDLSEQFLHSIEKKFRFPEQSEEPSMAKSGIFQKKDDRKDNLKDDLSEVKVSTAKVSASRNGRKVVEEIAEAYGVSDINFIKPGIGEATRVLLRRIPWKIIVNERYLGADELSHIRQLAEEKGVPYEVSRIDLGSYKVCGIIKNLADV